MPAAGGEPSVSQGVKLFQQGEAALRDHNRDRAFQLFREAAAYLDEMDPVTAQRLQDHLQLLYAPGSHGAVPARSGAPLAGRRGDRPPTSLAPPGGDRRGPRRSQVPALRQGPQGGLGPAGANPQEGEMAGLESYSMCDLLLRRVDRSLADTRQYIAQNGPKIELNDKNNRTHEEMDASKR